MNAILAALSVLTAADLEGLSSPLTLRRARKNLDQDGMAPLSIGEQEGGGLVVAWPDATCRFPLAGGLADSECTCPARRLCLHRVRAILYLQHRPQPQPGPDAPTAEGWTPGEAWSLAALAKLAGRTLWRAAAGARADGLEVVQESATSATLPMLGVRVRFLPGRPLEEAICSCGSRALCVHRVLAALAWHPDIPEMDGLSEEARDLQGRLWARLAVLLAAGLDGLPPETGEGLEALAQLASTGLPAPARDLKALAGLLSAYQSRSAGPIGRSWLGGVGRLGARLSALAAPERGAPAAAVRGRGRRALLDAAPMELLGLGAEGFQGAGGSVLKGWFVLAETGTLVQSRVGRGVVPGEEPLPPGALWRAPLWGEVSTAQAVAGRVRLEGARLGPDGTLSGGAGVLAQVRDTPTAPEDLPPSLVAGDVGALLALWRQQPPPLLRDGREQSLPAVLALDSRRPFADAPEFSEVDQALRLAVCLAGGGQVLLHVRHAPETARLLTVLEHIPDWRAAPTHLLVRFWPTGGGVVAVPVSAWIPARDRPGPVSLGVGEGPFSRGPQRLWRVVRGEPRSAGEDLVQQRLGVLLDLLESLAVEGLAHGAWRAGALEQAALGLAELEMSGAAAAVGALAVRLRADRVSLRPDPQATLAAFVQALAWARSLEEGLDPAPGHPAQRIA